MTDPDLRALVQRLRSRNCVVCNMVPDIQFVAADELESLLARAEAAECTVRLLTPDASRWRMARNDPQWLGFDHDMLPEQIDAAADRELPERAANYRGGKHEWWRRANRGGQT